MKKLVLTTTLFFVAVFTAMPALAREDFLNPLEIDQIRDAEDAGKRVLLYLNFAQKRLDAARQKTISWKQTGSGEAIQKSLQEYNYILEALDDSLQSARDQRVELSKPLKELEIQANQFLRVLQQLKNAPIRNDYEFTLDEAVEMTRDELAEVKKGAYPEVEARKPPVNFPASPPPPSKSSSNEEGPPRKSRRSSSKPQ